MNMSTWKRKFCIALTIYRQDGFIVLLRELYRKISRVLHKKTSQFSSENLGEQLLLCQRELYGLTDFGELNESGPHITLLILGVGAYNKFSEHTIRSILKLHYPHYNAVLITDDHQASSDFHERFSTVYIGDGETWKAVLDQQICSCCGNYVAILQSGDCLIESSLNFVALEIVKNNPDLIYSDCCIDSPAEMENRIDNKINWYPSFLLSGEIIGHSIFFRKDVYQNLQGKTIPYINGLYASLALSVFTSRGSVRYIQQVLMTSKVIEPLFGGNRDNNNYFETFAQSYMRNNNIDAAIIWEKNKCYIRARKEHNPRVSLIVYFHSEISTDCRFINQLIVDTKYRFVVK